MRNIIIDSSLFRVGDVTDWQSFVSKLRRDSNTVQECPGKRIWILFSQSVKDMIEKSDSVQEEDKLLIINALNDILSQRDFYRRVDFSDLKIHQDAQDLLNKERNKLLKTEIQRLNRLLLETAYPYEIAKSPIYIPKVTVRLKVTDFKKYIFWGPYNWSLEIITEGPDCENFMNV